MAPLPVPVVGEILVAAALFAILFDFAKVPAFSASGSPKTTQRAGAVETAIRASPAPGGQRCAAPRFRSIRI